MLAAWVWIGWWWSWDCQASGHFKTSWKLPACIISSTKGSKYVFCNLCLRHFRVSHGELNNVTRHVGGAGHQQWFKDVHGTSNLEGMHNMSFQTTDSLLQEMFPDSAIASDFACKHTKTRSNLCEALDPHYKKPIISVCLLTLCDESNDRGDSSKASYSAC